VITVYCQKCSKEFETVPARIKNGRGKFCSRKCYELSKRRVEIRTCPICGNSYEATPGTRKLRCSRECFNRSRRTLVVSECANCGKGFEHHKARNARFCPVDCRHAWQRKVAYANQDVRTCPVCEKEFRRKPSDRAKHCSLKCAAKSRRRKIATMCAMCSKTIMVPPAKFKKRESGRFFCGRECYAAWRKTLVGPQAYPWKGGKSFEPYSHKFNHKFKVRIRKRDQYTCAICRLRGRAVHHIDYDKENTTAENCITLCRTCHAATGGNRDYWQSNLEQLIKARGYIRASAKGS